MIDAALIRHAESLSNVGLPTDLPETISLTERGWAQARALAAEQNTAPALIVTSAYLRTQQTVEPLLARFPGTPQAVWPIHEFTYLSPALCRGTTREQRRPWVEAFWARAEPDYVHGPGAESFNQLIDRVRLSFAHLRALDPAVGRVILVSHGQFMHAFMWVALAQPTTITPSAMREFREFCDLVRIPNTAALPLKIEPAGRVFVGPLDDPPRHS